MSKELLTEVLEEMHSIYEYISVDLANERISAQNEHKRQAYMGHLKELMAKVQATHPSIRPRMNTPSWKQGKKPAPPPPPPSVTPEEARGGGGEEGAENGEIEQEEYVDVEPTDHVEEAEDYLTFSPTQDELQEVYEEMTTSEQQQDVYEEPELPANLEPADIPEDLYEEPVPTSLNTPTPPRSQENSGSGLFERNPNQTSQSSMTMSMVAEDWNAVYSTAKPKGEKCRVKDLKTIVIKGYLEKLGGRSHKTWQKRYCVISGPLMYFYEKDNSKSYNNSIALPLFAPTESSEFTVPKKKQFSFILTHTDVATGKKKDYYFRANSESIRNKWVTAIKTVCDTANSTTFASATLPRMPSQHPTARTSPLMLRRTASVGKIEEELQEDVQQELYEEMGASEDTQMIDESEEYVDVPAASPNDQIQELNSSDESDVDEYVAVDPGEDPLSPASAQDESTLTLPPRQPPPPITPPPSSSSHQHPLPPVTAPPPSHHRPDPTVDLERVYIEDGNGIDFAKVFVAVWDFAAGDSDELNLKRGDLVLVGEPSSNAEWWYGETLDSSAAGKLGRAGFFPQSYSSSAFQVAS